MDVETYSAMTWLAVSSSRSIDFLFPFIPKREGLKVQTNLQSRLDYLKTTAMMKSREHMGPVELVNWWTIFRSNIREIQKFEDLDTDIQAQILEWESHPYKIIGS